MVQIQFEVEKGGGEINVMLVVHITIQQPAISVQTGVGSSK